jgi:hypothetical protein
MIIPREHYGMIDIPIVHDDTGPASYARGTQSGLLLGLLKKRDVVRGW